MKNYFITEDGQVINTKTKRTMKLFPNTKGYLRVVLSEDGYQKRYFVHRLVAEKYVPNPENKPQVNHKDGNKLNNHYTNLEWVTNQENRAHAVENGLHKSTKGEERANHILTEEDVKWMRDNYVKGKGPEFAKKFGISKQTVLNIIHYKKWKHVK